MSYETKFRAGATEAHLTFNETKVNKGGHVKAHPSSDREPILTVFVSLM